jgi:hypothetical protein
MTTLGHVDAAYATLPGKNWDLASWQCTIYWCLGSLRQISMMASTLDSPSIAVAFA